MFSRMLWALLAIALIVVCVMESVAYGWLIGATVIVFALIPDVALIGAFDEERRGMLRAERVLFYNVMHLVRFPLILAAIGALVRLPAVSGVALEKVLFAAGLAWLAHIAVDRVAGYGLRDREGGIRTVKGATSPGVCQA